jgi:hypothetical protein
VGRGDVLFRPNTGNKESLYMRKVPNFIPEAAESRSGEFWRSVLEEQEKMQGEPLVVREKKLPWHDIYVYSSEFLASVMLLVYEVLYPKPLVRYVASWQVAAKLTLEARVHKPLSHTRNSVLLMTAFSLQVTSKEGRNHDDSDAFVEESIIYWDQPRATAELQVALDKMSWPPCVARSLGGEMTSSSSKKHKH